MAGDIQIRDAVHNFISLQEREGRLVGTRVFQRLRGIRQLALASLVYPGAVHTRFDHSLGVMHVASKMAEAVRLGTHERRLTRCAALLHDIGHGPFSHVSEQALERYANRDSIPSDHKKEKIHELVTAMVIKHDKDIVKVLGESDCDDIISILNGSSGEPVQRSIISGPLDADKQDYLLRDSYFCGVEYGVFDIMQLHRSLKAHGAEYDRYLMLKHDGTHAAEQYMLAKYYLTTNVYRHKVRLITDQMIVRSITLGIERDNIDELKRLYSFDYSTEFVSNYVLWDDARFMHEFGAFGKYSTTKCGEMVQMLQHRNLLKRVFQIKTRELSPEARDFFSRLQGQEGLAMRDAIESRIAECISNRIDGIDKDFVIFHIFDIKSVKEMSRNDDAPILVLGNEEPRNFQEESALFHSIDERYKDAYIEVYAPVNWDTCAERQRITKSLKAEITTIIDSAHTESRRN